MNKIHSEFAFQSRELGAQIDDTLGEPPNKKYYLKVVRSLISEFAKGSAIDDVNLLSFALADYLRFEDPAGLLAESEQYDSGDAVRVMSLVCCNDQEAGKALTTVFNENPELARKAIITAFLYKNHKRWSDEDQTLEALQKQEDGDDEAEEEDDQSAPGEDIMNLFDSRGDENG